MSKQSKLKKITLTFDYDATKSLDATRKTQLTELYNGGIMQKGKEVIVLADGSAKGTFYPKGFEISDNNGKNLFETVKKIQKIFSININKVEEAQSIVFEYTIIDQDGEFSIIDQTEAIENYINSKEVIISNIEIFDSLYDDKMSFVKMSVTDGYLDIKITTDFSSFDELVLMNDKISKYITNNLMVKLFEVEDK